jgi:hypothetical protein
MIKSSNPVTLTGIEKTSFYYVAIYYSFVTFKGRNEVTNVISGFAFLQYTKKIRFQSMLEEHLIRVVLSFLQYPQDRTSRLLEP